MSNLKVFFPVGHNFCKFHFLQENTLPCFQTGVMSGSRSEKVMGWGGEGPLIHFFLPQREKKLCNITIHGVRVSSYMTDLWADKLKKNVFCQIIWGRQLPKSNLQKSKAYTSPLYYSIVLTPNSQIFYESNLFLSPNGFNLGRVDCITLLVFISITFSRVEMFLPNFVTLSVGLSVSCSLCVL